MTAPCDRFEREHLAELLAPDELDGDARAHLDSCAACSARAAEYQRIARAMRDIGASYVRRPDHLARLWTQLDAPVRTDLERAIEERQARSARINDARRLRRWPWLAGSAVALAAAAALLLWLRGGEPGPRFEVEVISHGAVAIRGDAGLGDHLRIRARAGAAVWIYRNDRELLLVCPRDCTRDGDALTGEVSLDAIGRYQIVWLSAASAPVPGGDLERDIAAATAAGASHELREIVVE